MALSAVVGGEPAPSVHWEKDNRAILPGLGITSSKLEHTHSLNIANSMLEDAGSYKVTAKNYLGEDSKLIQVDIQGNVGSTI